MAKTSPKKPETYRQCVLRKGNHYISALWILDKHACLGLTLTIQYTNARTGVMGFRGPNGRWVRGLWDGGWEIHEAWGRKVDVPDKDGNFPGTNNNTKIEDPT